MTYTATAAWLRERAWFGFVVGGVAWVVWLGSLAVGGWYKDAEGTLVGSDHVAFYMAGRCVRDDRQADMYRYDFAAVRAYQNELIGWEWAKAVAWRNPPFYALPYAATAGLSFYASFLAWTVIGLTLLAASVYLLEPARPGRVLLWALAFYPVFAAVSFGQNTLLSLFLFSAVYRLLDDGRTFAAGLVAGFLLFKPQLLLGLFVWWAVSPRRYAGCWLGVGVTGAALAEVSWLAVPEASRAFVETFRQNLAYGGECMWNKHTPRAFFEMLLPGHGLAAAALGAAVSLASIAGAVWVALRTGAPVAAMFPVAVFLSLWASPHALIYEWALLLAAGVVLWEQFPEGRDAWLCLFALAWLVLTVSTVVAKVQIDLNLPFAVQVSVPVLGMVGYRAARELAGEKPGAVAAGAVADTP